MITTLFLGSMGCLAYTYVGYPLLLTLASRAFPKPWTKAPITPSITLLVAAWNEEGIIEAKISNSLELDYPRDKLSVLIVSDGSHDRTVSLAKGFNSPQVRVLDLPRGGKTAALNRAMQDVTSDLVVFSDANVMLSPDALRKLSRHFADASIGGVSADVQLRPEGFSLGAPQGLYYRLERWVQTCESQLGSIIGADGGCYGIRREFFKAVPAHLINDDFIISMEVVKQGHRMIYDPEVTAYEESPADAKSELGRKIRVEHGNFQSLFSGWGVPGLSRPLLLLAYVSHKVMRWTAFVPLGVLLSSSAFLSLPGLPLVPGAPVFIWLARGMLSAQLVAYALALAGWQREQAGSAAGSSAPSCLMVPYYFVMENVAAVRGLSRALLGKGQWGRAATASRKRGGDAACASS